MAHESFDDPVEMVAAALRAQLRLCEELVIAYRALGVPDAELV